MSPLWGWSVAERDDRVRCSAWLGALVIIPETKLVQKSQERRALSVNDLDLFEVIECLGKIGQRKSRDQRRKLLLR